VDDFYARGATLRADNRLIHDFYLVQVKEPSKLEKPWAYYDVLEKISAKDANPPLSESQCPLMAKGQN